MDHDSYLKRRDELLKVRTDSLSAFDQATLTLGTGSLGLSVAFLDQIGPPFDQQTLALIVATWIGFSLVILANLLSYLFAKWNMDRKLRELDDRYKSELQHSEIAQQVEKSFWQRTATDICNLAAFVVFFLSILTFTTYTVQVQRHKLTLLGRESATEATMPIKKIGGVTEVSAAIPTETPASAGTSQSTSTSSSTKRKGLTETPAALPPRPPPSATDTSQKK